MNNNVYHPDFITGSSPEIIQAWLDEFNAENGTDLPMGDWAINAYSAQRTMAIAAHPHDALGELNSAEFELHRCLYEGETVKLGSPLEPDAPLFRWTGSGFVFNNLSLPANALPNAIQIAFKMKSGT